MFYTYVLKSEKSGKYYVGSTHNIVDRVARHNHGQVTSTKYGIPWLVIYKEQALTRNDAFARELRIKKYKGGAAFKKLLTWV